MPPTDEMHPFVALMRRYCIDYTNSHDQTTYPDLFTDDYTVHINGVALPLWSDYSPAVAALFAEAPGLGLTVHELVLDGDRLCMRFSEHASLPTKHGRRLAAWRGIGLYRWDGERLTQNHVEQDFAARRAQLRDGVPHAIDPAHLDPWMGTHPVAPDTAAEEAGRTFAEAGLLHEAADVHIDDGADALVVAPEEVRINDLFSAGRRVAVHATYRGTYRGGVPGLGDEGVGEVADLHVAMLLRVDEEGTVDQVHAVTSRDAVRAAWRGR